MLESAAVSAHVMRTVYLEITETQPGRAVVFRKATVLDDSVRIVFPPSCRVQMQRIEKFPPIRRYQLFCVQALAGQTLHIEGLGQIITEAVVRIQLSGGPMVSTILHAQRNQWTIPIQRSTTAIFVSYVGMGFSHIWEGFDHLLFLLALLLLVSRWGVLIWTVTAFTCSHSLTLGLTALGWLRLSGPVAEACIAWSLVLAAWEVTLKTDRPEQNTSNHADRVVIGMGFVFGLVHGLGFAGLLLSIGLPEHAIVSSLFGFNVGVELGQLLLVIPGFWVIMGWRKGWSSQWVDRLGAYLVGISGAYWLWQRIGVLLF